MFDGGQRSPAATGGPCNSINEGTGSSAETIRVVEEFQDLYKERLRKCASSNSPQGSQTKIKIMEDWVLDLTEQNKLLLNEVEGLEKDAAVRVTCLERTSSMDQLRQNEDLAEKTKRLCMLESELEQLKQIVCDKENQLQTTFRKNQNLINALHQKTSECAELQRLDTGDRLTQVENEVRCLKRMLSQKEIVLQQYTCQLNELRQQVACKENELEEVRSSRCSRLSEMELDLSRLQDVLHEKECQLEKCTKQIAELQQCIETRIQCNMDCRKVDKYSMTDNIRFSKVEEELKLKKEEVKKLFSESEKLKEVVNSGELQVEDLHKTLVQLQRASRDVQSALTAEVAEKHDAVVALRREAAQLEEQLRQSEMQTHFKDDIIKQLRKEVKLARAKESLAEIFGLKECPRIQMKEKIERLNAELEDRQTVIAELEQRLEAARTQELEGRINKLNRQLMSRERDIVALCNKMDYVRRYVKRLRDDEELSVKCGLEALLHELNEDSEWNKETRRSVTSMCSDAADSSVIVINRVPARSLSLPDSSLKKHSEWSLRTWSEPSVLSNQGVIDFIPDKCADAAKLRELQRNLDDSSAKLAKMWKDIKLLSLDISNNAIYNDLEEFKDDTKLDQETLAQINVEIQNIVNTLDPDSPQTTGVTKEYLLGCLENNMTGLLELLTTNELIRTDSMYSFKATPNCLELTQPEMSSLVEKFALHVGDSISILQQIKDSLPNQWAGSEGGGIKSIEQTLRDMQIILDDVISNRKRAYNKLCNIQKIQSESYCNISQRFATFNEMLAEHESTAKFMKHEVTNVVNKLASNEYEKGSKEDMILKSRSEVDCLKDKITVKEQEIKKKNRTIGMLKISLTQKMASVRPCRSSPLPCQTPSVPLDSWVIKNFEDKSSQAQQVVDDLRKEIESTMCKLIDREEKLTSLEKEVSTVNRSLFNVHLELRNIKQYLQSPKYSCLTPKMSKLESNLNQAELDVKRLLAKSQSYVRDKESMEKSRVEAQRAIATLQSDLSNLQIDMSDSLKTIKMQIASGAIHSSNEDSLVEDLRCQLDSYKKKIEQLEGDLTRSSVSGDYCLTEERAALNKSEGAWPIIPSIAMTAALDNTQLQLIEMQEDMKRSLQEAYSSLSSKDIDLLNTLQFAEEVERLKNEICGLQKDLDSRQKVIDNQQETIMLLEEGLERTKCETDSLSTKLQTLSCEKKSVEMENQRVMQELQAKVCSLQAAFQKGNANTNSHSDSWRSADEMAELRGANLELIFVAAKYQQACQQVQKQMADFYRGRSDVERRSANAVAALHVIVCRQRQQLEDFEQFEVEMRRQKSALEAQLKEKSSENIWSKQEIKKLKNLLNDSEVQVCEAMKQVDELKSVIKNLKSKLGENDGKSTSSVDLHKQFQHLQQIAGNLKLEKDLALNELEQERSTNTIHCSHINSLKNEYATKREEAEHWQNRANKLKENVTAMCEEMQKLRRENSDLSASFKAVQCQLETFKLELAGVKEENNLLSRKLMKSTQIAIEMREDHHRIVDQLNKEKEDLMQEHECLQMQYEKEIKSLKEQIQNFDQTATDFKGDTVQKMLSGKDMEWRQKYKEKCDEASVLYSELEKKNKEGGDKSCLLQKRKEAIDFLSGKVAELETTVKEKDDMLKYLECQLKQLAEKYEVSKTTLRNEVARAGQLEQHLSSTNALISRLECANRTIESEKEKLLDALSKKTENSNECCGSQDMALVASDGKDNLVEQRKFSIKLAQKLRIYKERLNTSLNHNRNLMETLDKLHSLNCVLLEEVQQSGRRCPTNWINWKGTRGPSTPSPALQQQSPPKRRQQPLCYNVGSNATDGPFWPQVRLQVAESEESEHF